MADLTSLDDQALEDLIHEANAKEAEAAAAFKAYKAPIRDELDRRASEKRIADLAGTMSDADKTALRAFLAADETVANGEG